MLGGRPVWLAAEVERAEVDIMEAAHTLEYRSLVTLKEVLETSPAKNSPEEEFLFHLMNLDAER